MILYFITSLIAIPYSYVSPSSYVETNINGTLNILNGKDLDIQGLFNKSTSETYGSTQFVPITGNYPLAAQSPYAASK